MLGRPQEQVRDTVQQFLVELRPIVLVLQWQEVQFLPSAACVQRRQKYLLLQEAHNALSRANNTIVALGASAHHGDGNTNYFFNEPYKCACIGMKAVVGFAFTQ